MRETGQRFPMLVVSAWPSRSLVCATRDASPDVMRTPLTEEDQDLDRQWRETFGEPMPILGGGDIVRQIIAEAKERQARSDTGT